MVGAVRELISGARRSVGTLVVAFTISGGVSAAPAAAYFYTANFQPYTAASLAHHQALEATVIRRHKQASGSPQRQGASGVGKRDGLPTGS